MMHITLYMIDFDLVKLSTHGISVYTIQYDSHVMYVIRKRGKIHLAKHLPFS